jgi:hypothetical protein
VGELADPTDLKSVSFIGVPVRVRPRLPLRRSEMSFDEKAFDTEMERQRYLTPTPTAAYDRDTGKFIPEIMMGGANWIVGTPKESREEAKQAAGKFVPDIHNHLRDTIDSYIQMRGWKKAKA